MLIEAIEIKRKMFFEYEDAPYHCLDVEVSKPTARGGQTLVRLKMRNLLTRAVFDKTFKAGEKFSEPDLVKVAATLSVQRRRRLSLHGPGDVRDVDAQRVTCSATIGCCSSTICSSRSKIQRASDRRTVPADRRIDVRSPSPACAAIRRAAASPSPRFSRRD